MQGSKKYGHDINIRHSKRSTELLPTVHNKLHVTNGLVQRIHAALLQQLPHNLVGNLVSPVVDGRHRYVIDEDRHDLATRRAKGAALALLNAPLCEQLHCWHIALVAAADALITCNVVSAGGRSAQRGSTAIINNIGIETQGQDSLKPTDLNRHLEDLWSCQVGEGDGLGGGLLRVEA